MGSSLLSLSNAWKIALSHPSRRIRVFRRLEIWFYIFMTTTELGLAVQAFVAGDGLRGFTDITYAVVIACIGITFLHIWARDVIAQDLAKAILGFEAVDSSGKTVGTGQIVNVVPSEEATDPNTYAMMRALETGKPIHIEVRDGVWYENGKPIPHVKGNE